MENEDYRKLIDHRSVLVELSNSQIALFDKSTLALSTGAIGISILFLDKLSSLTNVVDIVYLLWSWVLLLTTILLNLGSYLTSWAENRRLVKLIDRSIVEGNAERFTENSKSLSFTLALNCFCLLTFSVGVILLAVFALNNLERSQYGQISKPSTVATSS